MAERECAREVIGFILAVLQNCEITDAAEVEVDAIIRKHAAANVKGLTDTAEKLLEWMPIYSKGSSGHIRQMNLRAAIDKLKAEPVESPSSNPESKIVPPIAQQHRVAQQIASEHMFDPREPAYARCVGAIMQAWRPGVIWEPVGSEVKPRTGDKS